MLYNIQRIGELKSSIFIGKSSVRCRITTQTQLKHFYDKTQKEREAFQC